MQTLKRVTTWTVYTLFLAGVLADSSHSSDDVRVSTTSGFPQLKITTNGGSGTHGNGTGRATGTQTNRSSYTSTLSTASRPQLTSLHALPGNSTAALPPQSSFLGSAFSKAKDPGGSLGMNSTNSPGYLNPGTVPGESRSRDSLSATFTTSNFAYPTPGTASRFGSRATTTRPINSTDWNVLPFPIFPHSDPDVTATLTEPPAGVKIETHTKTTCTNNAFLTKTTQSGNTETTIVPELCVGGFAFLLFGMPNLPSLCHKAMAFPFGIVFKLICPPNADVDPIILSVDPIKLKQNDPDNPDKNPDQDPDDDPSDRATRSGARRTNAPSSGAEKSSMITKTMTGASSSTSSTKISTYSTRTTSTSSSSTALGGRYIVMPVFDAATPAITSMFAKCSDTPDLTVAKKDDGSIDFWAGNFSDSLARSIHDDPDFIAIPESVIPISPDGDGTTNTTSEAGNSTSATEKKRSIETDNEFESPHGRLTKRAIWYSEIGSWARAIVSRPPEAPLTNGEYIAHNWNYPYTYDNSIPPGQGVRVYLLDTGMNMEHPEFSHRRTRQSASIEGRYNIDWLFPRVDNRERFWDRDAQRTEYYTFSWRDPNTAPADPNRIHQAFTDYRFRWATDGSLTPHGTRLSGSIIGRTLGLAPYARFTVVKLPAYTNGPLGANANFPLFSVRDGIGKIRDDINRRKDQGETLFVISSSLGYPFGDDDDVHPESKESAFSGFWQDSLRWFRRAGVTFVASSGNSAQTMGRRITLAPARLTQWPHMVAGSVMPDGRRHPGSQGRIGNQNDVTVYTPGLGMKIVSNTYPGLQYNYVTAPTRSAATSQACAVLVGYVAYTLALAYAGFVSPRPATGQRPNEYVYDRVIQLRRRVRSDGELIIYNGSPMSVFARCGGRKAKRAEDDDPQEACPLSLASIKPVETVVQSGSDGEPSEGVPEPISTRPKTSTALPPKPTFGCWSGKDTNPNPRGADGDGKCTCTQSENWKATTSLAAGVTACPTQTWNTNPPAPTTKAPPPPPPPPMIVQRKCKYPADEKNSCMKARPGNGPGGFIPNSDYTMYFCSGGSGTVSVAPGDCPPYHEVE